ncbi:MAG: glucose-6-phosphate dehydrogenase [Acidobacteria bacterium]|nr:glucose-6-phosphate dehydrogenase [Acidobacteriota bacterium]
MTPAAAIGTAPHAEKPAPRRRLDPCGIVIFGASGDLTGRKLIPALYRLFQLQRLPESFYVLGVARRELAAEGFRRQMQDAVAGSDARAWEEFAARLDYFSLDASDPASYQRLKQHLREQDQQRGTQGNHMFYLAVPPALYAPIIGHLSGACGSGWSRLVIEKPFGHDRESARRLNAQLREAFREEQVYRIDHFLGKETVQNLAVLRFANGIFEPLWNRNYIDHVQITVAEDLGVEHRAGFYEKAGAVRDMIQNHLLQVLCLVAMEPPASFEARFVHAEKLQVLESLRPLHPGNAVRGQYGAGEMPGGAVPGYCQEPGVDSNSRTETFAAMKLELESWRWAGVPFYLRTGKRMPRKVSEVSIQFRDAPLQLFACTAMQPCAPNLLRLRLQPDEGISLRVLTKTPGLEVVGRPAELDFAYGADLARESPGAYETLLLDVLEGDSMLFATGDWVEAAWAVVDPLLETWAAAAPADFPNYAAGAWGPRAGDELLERDGRRWHLP